MIDVAGFRNITALGSGGLGDVYRAVRSSTGSTVAIKVLRDWTNPDVAWARAQREVRALVVLRGHPHVIHVEEVVQLPEGVAVVMEYAPGGSVLELMTRNGGHLSSAETLLVAEQTASALAASHDKGIIHRDIKPHNLLVGAFGQVKVCDFGIAAMLAGSATDRTDALTFRYASPEEIRGDAEVTAATDVYSLGSTLVHVWTGSYLPLPGLGESGAPTLSAPSGLTGVPAGVVEQLVELVREMTAVDPLARPSAASVTARFASLAHALGDARCQALPVLVTSDDTVVRPARPTTGEVSSPTGRHCPACGVWQQRPSTFCPSCGWSDATLVRSAPVPPPATVPVTAPVPTHSAPVGERGQRGPIAVILGSFVVLLIAAVTLVSVLGGSGEGAANETDVDDSDETSATQPGAVADTATVTTAQLTLATTVPPTSGTLATTTTPPTTPVVATTAAVIATPAPTAPPVVDNSAAARAFVDGYFGLVAEDRFSEAYARLGPSMQSQSSFESFVDFWGMKVESFRAPIEGCNVIGALGECIVRYAITYSELAGPESRNSCIGERSRLFVELGPNGFLISGQERIEGVSC